MMHIDSEDFVTFVKTKEGQVLNTRAQSKQFMVRVTKKGLEYTPLSTMKPRPHQTRFMERVIEQFCSTRSFKTSEYRQFTVCSSYTLALIGQYLEQMPH